MITEEQILNALSTVEEPDLKEDLVTLKMIENITIEHKNIAFTVILTTPACPLKEKIETDCILAIKKYLNDDELQITITMVARTTSRATNTGDFLPNVKNILLVSSGKGGVGKSTVASNLAIAFGKMGAKVGLLDADIYGPSLPILFNLQGKRPQMQSIDGKDKIIPIQKYGVDCISIGLLIDESQAVVWRGPMATSALRQFLTDVEWGELDYLVVDLPPGTGDIHLSIASMLKVAGAIVVTTPPKIAVADARKGAAMFAMPQINIPILGVVENMAYFTPEAHPNEKYYLFGQGGGKQLAQELNVELLAELPMVQAVAESVDNGLPAVNDDKSMLSPIFKRLAQRLAQLLAIQNAQV